MNRALNSAGSSPRVRGTREGLHLHEIHVGIIPACAGNTSPWCYCRCRGRDHPRVCGEHRDRILQTLRTLGSSPRVRGTHVGVVVEQNHVGIIPACAGNTAKASLIDALSWDHPRVCGEHGRRIPARCSTWGSSPRVRGTLGGIKIINSHPGIIPACAGNTHRATTRHIARRDHPRVCGEHG